MSKFVIKSIQAVEGHMVFKQLIIVDNHIDTKKLQEEINLIESNPDKSKRKVENKGVWDDYKDKLEEKYQSAYARILGNMNRVANMQPLPQEKFKDVTPKKETVAEYEYKYGDLRVWAIKILNGQLIIHCGYKNSQKSDFRVFRGLKEQYLKLLKS